MPSRRRVLRVCVGTAGALLAGCLSQQPGTSETATGTPTTAPTDTPTETCSAQDPPAPTDAATAPRSYPDRPAELTTDTVEEFLDAYESVYQYNDALAANPEKIGRTNEIRVAIESVSVTADDNGFTAEVSGQFYSEILDTDSETTPETPLPMGRGPVGATYTVTERALVRDGVVVEYW